jgi:hypothetical protein
MATLFTEVGLRAPEGVSYAKGDTLMAYELELGFSGYGEIVVPTGLIRITGQSSTSIWAR